MSIPTPLTAEENPLLHPWEGPNGGVPPFDKVKPELLGPALEHSMELYRQDIKQIADNPAEADFDNTVGALERAGRTFDHVSRLFEVFASTMNGPEIKELEREWSPKFSAIYDEIIQNQALFGRIRSIYQRRDHLGLTPEQSRLLWLTYNRFVKSGAELSGFEKKKLAQLNARLATLYTDFGQNLLADEETQRVVFSEADKLAGLPQSMIDAAAAEAEAFGLENQWVVRNTRSSAEPFLTYADDREARREVWQMWVSRGDGGGDTDNNAIVTEILKLRARKAQMLGFATHAHWQLSDAMAQTPESAMELMEKVWQPAVARVEEEVADMLEVAAELGHSIEAIEPWDYRYYAEKVRQKKYDLDESQLKPYLQLDKLLQAQFWVAQELFDLHFEELSEMPVYHAEVRVFEVKNGAGAHVGYWYFDPYARDGKRSGAWMSEYRTQEAFDGVVSPIVSNNSNYIKGKPGEAVLISWDDAETMFHEFGHALHGLLSRVNYPTLAGTNVARDFVEFPSQLTEHWLSTPQLLKKFAVHYQTGESIPESLIEKVEKAATFNQGFSTVEYLSSALIDMKLHLASGEIDPRAFEKEVLGGLGMPSSIVMRHRIPQFAHIFSGDYYSAAYYSYLWAEVLDQDAWKAFEESVDGPFDKQLAKRLVDSVLSAGNTAEPAESYRAFRGHDASIKPLLEARGFPTN